MLFRGVFLDFLFIYLDFFLNVLFHLRNNLLSVFMYVRCDKFLFLFLNSSHSPFRLVAQLLTSVTSTVRIGCPGFRSRPGHAVLSLHGAPV